MPIWSPAFFGSAAGSSGYVIEDSVWFDGSADYLTFTPSQNSTSQTSAGDGSKFTLSMWLKRSAFGSDAYLFESATNDDGIRFDGSSNQMRFFFSTASSGDLQTNAVFRDPTAWQHWVFSIDTDQGTSTNRVKLYLNGSQISSFGTSTYPAEHYDLTWVANGVLQTIGRLSSGSSYYNGYLAEVILLDGTAESDASKFGELNDEGVWVPIEPSGLTFGNNGFHLDFKVAPGTGNGAGTDVSGNGNHFTENSMTAVQQVSDSPTNDSDNDIGNYSTLSSLYKVETGRYLPVSNGNLTFTNVDFGRGTQAMGTVAISSGKFYWEVSWSAIPNELASRVGIAQIGDIVGSGSLDGAGSQYLAGTSGSWGFLAWESGANAGKKETNGTKTDYYNATTSGSDTIGVAFDADNGAIWIAKNNSWIDGSRTGQSSSTVKASIESYSSSYVMFSGLTSGPYIPGVSFDGSPGTGEINFGQTAFTYTPPSGFKALNTANLSSPTVTDPSAYFQNKTYTGNGSTNALTFDGNSDMQPDLVWIKCRSNSRSHVVVDSVRGGASYIHTDSDSAQTTASPNNLVTAFGSDGFTLGDISNANANTETFVAWCMKVGGAPTATNSVSPSDGATMTSGSVFKGGSAHSFTPHNDATIFPEKMSIASHNGFSIVYYEGNATAGAKVPHGLDAAPDMIIMKNFSDTGPGWYVYHTSVGTSNYLRLETDSAQTSESNYVWNGTAPDANLFTLGGGSSYVNDSGKNHIAYCIKRTSGLIGIGSYVGNGSADGPLIIPDDNGSGFRSAWFMSKQITDAGYNWQITDAARDPENPLGYNASANLNGTDGDGSGTYMDFTSNSVKIRTSSPQWNASGKTYIYLAFAETPFGLNNRAR
jgi:hypothetical protein